MKRSMKRLMKRSMKRSTETLSNVGSKRCCQNGSNLRPYVMGELVDGQPLFPGESDIDQLYIIQVGLVD